MLDLDEKFACSRLISECRTLTKLSPFFILNQASAGGGNCTFLFSLLFKLLQKPLALMGRARCTETNRDLWFSSLAPRHLYLVAMTVVFTSWILFVFSRAPSPMAQPPAPGPMAQPPAPGPMAQPPPVWPPWIT